MELKEWVRAARKHRNWTLAELGEAVGRSKSNIGLWETGTHSPSYAQVLQIAAETGFPLPHLVKFDADGRVQAVREVADTLTARAMEVPVLGSAIIADNDYFFVLDGARGNLSGIHVPNGYAVEITKDGGNPIVKHANFIVLDQKVQPGFGDYCVVAGEDGRTRFLEFLAKERGVVSLSGKGGERITIAEDEVTSLEVVIAVVSKQLWRPPLEKL